MADETCQTSPATCGEPPDPLAWFGGMIDHCYDYAEAARGAGPADCRDHVRVHAARDHPGGGRGAGVPVRRIGGHHPGGRAASAGQPLPAHQVHLRLPRHGQEPLPELGRPGRGGDDLRRQEEDVRAAGRLQADVCARTAAEGRGPRRARTLGARVAQVPAVPGGAVRGRDHRRQR